jgi:acyl-coenzyme A thioesterase PaaI-like protein
MTACGGMSSESDVRLDLEPWRESGNLVFDLDVTSVLVSETRSLLHAPFTPGLAANSGEASLGMLVSLIDVAAAEPALVACRPDWTATQDLSVHATQTRLVEGPVVVDAQLTRAGKNAVTVTANVYDAHGVDDLELMRRGIDGDATAARPTRISMGLVTFVRLPRTSTTGMDGYDPWNWVGKVRRRTFARPPVGTLEERMGVQVVDAAAGILELPRTRYVSNAIGTIFGGAQATLLQLAAEAMRPGLVATDLQLHYLSQVRVGPARTRGTVSRDAADHSVITMELTDAGYRNQLLALATVTLQRSAR